MSKLKKRAQLVAKLEEELEEINDQLSVLNRRKEKIFQILFHEAMSSAEERYKKTFGKNPIKELVLRRSIEVLRLPIITTNQLKAQKILTVRDLIKHSHEELLLLTKLGHRRVDMIVQHLAFHELALRKH